MVWSLYPLAPGKADAPLTVDANTMLPFSVAFKLFQVISRGGLGEVPGRVKCNPHRETVGCDDPHTTLLQVAMIERRK